MIRDMLNIFGLAVSLITGIIGSFIFCLYMWYLLIEKPACADLGAVYNTETNFTVVNGCYIKKDGKFLPRAQFTKTLIPNAVFGNSEFVIKTNEGKE